MATLSHNVSALVKNPQIQLLRVRIPRYDLALLFVNPLPAIPNFYCHETSLHLLETFHFVRGTCILDYRCYSIIKPTVTMIYLQKISMEILALFFSILQLQQKIKYQNVQQLTFSTQLQIILTSANNVCFHYLSYF